MSQFLLPYLFLIIGTISLLFLAILLFWFLLNNISKWRISKINIRGIEIESIKNETSQETILEKEIKEIVYLIKSSRANVVVIEDLDRFKDIKILERLRQINNILNKHIKTLNKTWYHTFQDPVKFIYMISDELFNAETRTKFFDFIIPINHAKYSKDKVKTILKGVLPEKELEKDLNWLIEILPNLRVLKNVVNEFNIYKELLKNTLNDKLLLGAMILKNLLPKEFIKLQEKTSYINLINSNYSNILNQVEYELNKQLADVSKDIRSLENINSKIASNIFNMSTKIIALLKDENQLNNNLKTKNYIKNLTDLLDQKISEIYVVYKNFDKVETQKFNLIEFNKKFIQSSAILKKLISNIKKETKNTKLDLEKKKDKIANDILKFKNYKLAELLDILQWEKSVYLQNLFNNDLNSLKIIKVLIKECFNDDNFYQLIKMNWD